MSEVNDILKLIEETKTNSKYTVYSPTAEKELDLYPLNAENQKELVKALVDSPFYSTVFNVKFFEILQEVYRDEFPISDLTILDKPLLAIKIRSENLNDEYTSTFKKDSGEETFTKTISLSSHLESLDVVSPKDTTIEADEYKVDLTLPKMIHDYQFEKYLTSVLKQLENENIKELIGQIYLTNILKYIKTLVIKDKVINFQSIPIEGRIEIGKTLPAKITRKIIKEIDAHFGPSLSNTITYKFTKNKKEYTGRILVDNTFFTSA